MSTTGQPLPTTTTPPAAPAETAAPAAGPTPPAAVVPGGARTTGEQGPPSRKRGRETAADMVRSLAVCLALVAFVYVLFIRPQPTLRQPADLTGATSDARAAGLDVRAPHLPAGWTLSNADFAPDATDGLPTWHVTYVTPDHRAASVDVARGADPTWVQGVLGDTTTAADDAPARTRQIAGTPWQVVASTGGSDPARGFVHVEGQVTTAVTGHASAGDLAVLAAAVSR